MFVFDIFSVEGSANNFGLCYFGLCPEAERKQHYADRQTYHVPMEISQKGKVGFWSQLPSKLISLVPTSGITTETQTLAKMEDQL